MRWTFATKDIDFKECWSCVLRGLRKSKVNKNHFALNMLQENKQSDFLKSLLIFKISGNFPFSLYTYMLMSILF